MMSSQSNWTWVQRVVPRILVVHQQTPTYPVRVPLRRRESKQYLFGGAPETKDHTGTVICVIWRSGESVADTMVRNLNQIHLYDVSIGEVFFGRHAFRPFLSISLLIVCLVTLHSDERKSSCSSSCLTIGFWLIRSPNFLDNLGEIFLVVPVLFLVFNRVTSF